MSGICWSQSPSLRVTAPNAVPLGPLWTSTSAPVVPSTTYFSVFSFSFFLILLSTGISTSISTALICFLSNTDICSWFASSCLCVWNWNSQRILALVVLGHFRRCMPSGLTNFSSISSTDVPDSRGNLCTDSTLSPAIFTFLVLVYVCLVPVAHLLLCISWSSTSDPVLGYGKRDSFKIKILWHPGIYFNILFFEWVAQFWRNASLL